MHGNRQVKAWEQGQTPGRQPKRSQTGQTPGEAKCKCAGRGGPGSDPATAVNGDIASQQFSLTLLCSAYIEGASRSWMLCAPPAPAPALRTTPMIKNFD